MTIVPPGMWHRIICWFGLFVAMTPLPKRVVAQTQTVHLWISNRYLAEVDSNIVISQFLTDTLKNPAQFFSENIEYDKSIVEFIDVTNGAQTPQPSWTVSKTVTTPGNVEITGVSIGPPLVDTGEIIRLIFHVVDTAQAFQTTPILDSAANFGAGTSVLSDTGLLRIYDECTPIIVQNGVPITLSTESSPNPASALVTILYSLPTSLASVEVRLFDPLGTLVRRATLGPENIGWHTTSLDISGLANGIYYYTVIAGNSEQFHSIMVAH